jgi:hypothetical protein
VNNRAARQTREFPGRVCAHVAILEACPHVGVCAVHRVCMGSVGLEGGGGLVLVTIAALLVWIYAILGD